MCQKDCLMLEEYKNPLIENFKSSLFSVNSYQLDTMSSTESIFLNFILFWVSLMNDSRNLASIHIIYLHALNTIKTIYLSSSNKKIYICHLKVLFIFLISIKSNGNVRLLKT